jgi:putative acetyltransferase
MYPHDREHSLSLAEMAREGVAFFVLYADGLAAGCGALKPIGPGCAEVIRMYIRPSFRGIGLGGLMLRHLEGSAMEQGIMVLHLKRAFISRKPPACTSVPGTGRSRRSNRTAGIG